MRNNVSSCCSYTLNLLLSVFRVMQLTSIRAHSYLRPELGQQKNEPNPKLSGAKRTMASQVRAVPASFGTIPALAFPDVTSPSFLAFTASMLLFLTSSHCHAQVISPSVPPVPFLYRTNQLISSADGWDGTYCWQSSFVKSASFVVESEYRILQV